MLPICLGEATKVAGDILAGRKCYRFTIALGSATRTGDAEGELSGTAPVPQLEPAAVTAVLRGFVGPQPQVPPMYSALKRDGQPLYKLARAGLSVPRAAREIELFELSLLELAPATLELRTLCSKGTYVRVLAEDIAAALGTCGHVQSLRREYVEPFAEQPMQTLEELAAAACARPADCAVADRLAAAASAGAADVRPGRTAPRARSAGPERSRRRAPRAPLRCGRAFPRIGGDQRGWHGPAAPTAARNLKAGSGWGRRRRSRRPRPEVSASPARSARSSQPPRCRLDVPSHWR